MTTTSTTAPPVAPARARGEPLVRADIQGLRAVAVSLVLLYHLWPNRLTGGFVGVDVFFVISGFLITSHLLSKPPQDWTGLAQFWSRRIRRLLPASLTVIAAVLVATRLVASETQWKSTALDAIASTLYVQNWRLAFSAVDYLASENAVSPIQHYWSLSVEEQFYLVWPVLLVGVGWLARRRGASLVRVALVVISALTAVSLAYSVYATATEPASAYFISPTRIWELGVGAVLAALVLARHPGARVAERIPGWSQRARWRAILAWLGLAAIAWSALTYTGQTPFPSWRALLPVLGCAAVIGAHSLVGRGSPTVLLRLPPVQWLGGVSYSVYLWHWPMIVLLPYVSGSLGRLDKAAILAATAVLAALTKTFVEDRFRRPRAGTPLRRPFQLAAVGMAVIMVAGLAQVAEVQLHQRDAQAAVQKALAGGVPCFGAAEIAQGPPDCPVRTDGEVLPSPAEAAEDRSPAYSNDCWESPPYGGTRSCSFGDPDGTVSIALVGNSHAGQWLPALQVLAAQRHWRITTYLASTCTATDAALDFGNTAKTEGCLAWGRRVRELTAGDAFDLVLTSERNVRPALGQKAATSMDAWRAGYDRYLTAWAAGGTKLLVIKDTPFPARTMGQIPDCVAQHRDDFTACSAPVGDWMPQDPLVEAARARPRPGVQVVDMGRYLCDQRCRGVIGGVIVYFDNSHLTATYAKTVAPYLDAPIAAALR